MVKLRARKRRISSVEGISVGELQAWVGNQEQRQIGDLLLRHVGIGGGGLSEQQVDAVPRFGVGARIEHIILTVLFPVDNILLHLGTNEQKGVDQLEVGGGSRSGDLRDAVKVFFRDAELSKSI